MLYFCVEYLVRFAGFQGGNAQIQFTQAVITDGLFRSQAHLFVFKYVEGFVLYNSQQQGMQVAVFFPAFPVFP